MHDIRGGAFKKYSAVEKLCMVPQGFYGEESIAKLCCREGLHLNACYLWFADFMEAGKKRLAGDTLRDATSDEVKELGAENAALKESLGEVMMENRLLLKIVLGDGEDAI